MKTIYLECNMGAAGDMIMAALLELCDNKQKFLDELNAVGIPDVVVSAETSVKCGITGTRVNVTVGGRDEDAHNHHYEHDHDFDLHEHEHHHTGYHDIEHVINDLNVSDIVKQNALAIYKIIADAESKAHGVTVDKIHFHEVGEKDAIADIVGVCMLMEELSPDVVFASPINVGSGHVHCAHGVLPVPAPATAHILQNVPIYSDQIDGELCTPTGAAILKHFTKKFRGMPMLSVAKIGYGMGKKDFKKANCVRAYIGEFVRVVSDDINEYVVELASDIDDAPTPSDTKTQFARSVNPPPTHLVELSCNLDDMTPEAIAFAQETLLREGALDVWTSSIGMKKSRPGMMFSCLCHGEAKEKMLSLIFKHTTTLGIRETAVRRHTLQRETSNIETEYGSVKIKTSFGFGVERSKAEYDDVTRIAREKGLSIDEVLNTIWAEP